MLRFYLRLTLIPIALFTAVLIIIRAQPYDDHELRQLLLPEGCPAPCFMGIRPGITLEKAIQLLEAGGFVKMETKALLNGSIGPIMNFKWNGKQPRLIDEQFGISLTYQDSSPNKIMQIAFQVQSDVQLGTINRMLGKPSRVEGSSIMGISLGDEDNPITIYQFYDFYHMDLSTVLDCPTSLNQILKTGSVIVVYNNKFPTWGRNLKLKDILQYPDC